MNCQDLENAKRQQLQKNCIQFKVDKKSNTDCRRSSSILLALSKKLCSFYNHTFVEDVTQNHRARIGTTNADMSYLNEPLALEEAFPSDEVSLHKVAEHITTKIMDCTEKIPEITTFDVICIGTGMNTKPEKYIYTYLQRHLTNKNLKFKFIICDPNYSDENMKTIRSEFDENITVVKKLPDPAKLNYDYGKVIIAFSGIDAWIRKAHDVFKFMINMWYIIADRCEVGEKSAIVDIFYTRNFSELYKEFSKNVDRTNFGNFWAAKLTDILYTNSFRFEHDDHPIRAKKYALNYTCDDTHLINPSI